MIGSNSTILPVRVVFGSVIGASSVVTKNIIKKGVYAGCGRNYDAKYTDEVAKKSLIIFFLNNIY